MPDFFDEMYTADAQVREHYCRIHDGLLTQPPDALATKRAEADLIFRRVGITFAVYGSDDGTERSIPVDIVPRIIARAEWEKLEKGLIQKVRALNMFIHDLSTQFLALP